MRRNKGISIVMKIAVLHKSRLEHLFASFVVCLLSISYSMSQTPATAGQTENSRAIGPSLIFDHPDAFFIECLLKNELFDVAMETCRTRYKLAIGTQPEASAQWSMLEMHALAAKIAADPRIIDEPAIAAKLLIANQVIVDRELDSPRLLWLKQRQQWCRWLVLRRMQVAYIAVPARKAIRDWSIATIRECLSELEAIQSEIQKAPARDIRLSNKSSTTPEQWSSLTNDVTLLQTDFLLLRALYYPAKSAERIGAATEMLTAIGEAELRISIDWPGRPNIDLARYAAFIHLDRSQDALDGISSLNKKLQPTADGKPKLGNRWRLHIATLAAEACRNLGNIDESNRWLDSVGGWTAAPEIAIEYFANLVTVPAGQSATESQITAALKVKTEIGVRFGIYWQQRADAILLANSLSGGANALSTNTSSPNSLKVELLLSEAKQLLTAKRTDEAIEKFGQAETSAANSGDEAIAMEMAINAAAVLSFVGRKEESEGEFHRAAMTYSQQRKAPDAAIMSVLGFVKTIPIKASTETLSPEEEAAELKQQVYRGRLMDIVNTWPSSEQAIQSLSQLDGLFLATNQIPELMALWGKRLDQAMLAKPAPDGGSKWRFEYDQAIGRFALICTATQDAWFDRSVYTTEKMKRTRQGLEDLKSKLTERADPSESMAVRLILGAISDSSRWPIMRSNANGAPREASTSAAFTFLSPLTIQNSPFELEELFSALDAAKFDSTTRLSLTGCVAELMFQRFVQIGVSRPIEPKDVAYLKFCVERLGELEQRTSNTIGSLQSSQLDRSVKLYIAAIQCWTGDEAKGLKTINSEIASAPKVPWWAYRSARVYQTIAARRAQAMTQFRQLAAGFPAGSEAWLDARARTAQTMRLLGDAAKAKELAAVVFAAYPSATQEWQTRFER